MRLDQRLQLSERYRIRCNKLARPVEYLSAETLHARACRGPGVRAARADVVPGWNLDDITLRVQIKAMEGGDGA
jgi:hypothetical protein